MIGLIQRYLLGATATVALCAIAWGAWQGMRADQAREALSKAQATIQRLNAEAEQRREIDNAIEDIDGLDPDGLTRWLRDRAGAPDG